jgi:hypothetical protein
LILLIENSYPLTLSKASDALSGRVVEGRKYSRTARPSTSFDDASDEAGCFAQDERAVPVKLWDALLRVSGDWNKTLPHPQFDARISAPPGATGTPTKAKAVQSSAERRTP